MKRLAFYISGHGFGHASREVEVINRLGPQLESAGADPCVLIRSSVSPSLLARTLRVPYALQPAACDTGIVQINSVTHDDPRTIAETAAFYATFDERVDAETRAVASSNIGLVVGDIPPLAFAVADRLGVPSVAIANFLWDWIYEGYPDLIDRAPGVLPAIRAAYAHTGLGLRLPFSHAFTTLPRVEDIPLIARHATRSRAETRARFALPPDRPIALLSFGGYGLPSLDLSALDCLADWTILVTDRSLEHAQPAAPAAVRQITEGDFAASGFRYEDLVGAVDVVISKPGYGIVAECIAAGTPLVYTSRGHFREYDVFVEEMPRYLRCAFLSQADLFGGRWRDTLDDVVRHHAPPRSLPTNGADVAAAAILRALAHSG